MNLAPVEMLNKIAKREPFPNVTVIYGEESHYRTMLSAKLPEYFMEGIAPEDRSVAVFEKDTNLNELEAALNTYPFFGGPSVVLLRDEKLWNNRTDSVAKKLQLERLISLLSDIPEYCYVVLTAEKFDKRTAFFKNLAKKFLLCECQPVRTENLAPWLRQQAEIYGGSFERDAVAAILEYLTPVEYAPLELLRQEIAKLAVYAGSRNKWTREDVESIFSALPEVSGFTLLKAIAAKDLDSVLKILDMERKNGTNVLPICGSVLYQLRKMLRFLEYIRLGFDQKDIIKELKMLSFLYGQESARFKRFTEKELSRAIVAVVELNANMRRGGRTYARLEEIMIELLRS